MPILVDTVRISGFRGIRDFEMSLPRFAVLIGPNNCGKTSVLKALQLALGDYSRHLSDEDFHIDGEDSRSEKIIVDVRIVATTDEGERDNAFSKEWLIPTVIDQNPCAHLRMPRDMIFHGWSMMLFQAWQHSATMSS